MDMDLKTASPKPSLLMPPKMLICFVSMYQKILSVIRITLGALSL